MKKNLFYVFALICSMSLFTACSDDEDETWKEIPTEEIDVASGNATVNINGTTSTTGSVKMTVKNESEATMALQNVIPGYADLNIDVELQKQADNSFKYAGTAEVNTAPSTREVSSDPAILTVEVDGIITLDGKVTVNVTAFGPGLLVGTYTGDQLVLKYSGMDLTGKTVYYTVTNSVPVLTLANVIPGELTTAISGVYPDDKGTFSGEVTTTSGATVAYSGILTAASGMTLDLNVTLSATAQGGIAGNWVLADTITQNDDSKVDNSPLHFVWTAPGYYAFGEGSALSSEQIATMAQLAVVPLLSDVLNQVSFATDGNITAKYYSGTTVTMDWIMGNLGAVIPSAGKTWLASPSGLVSWYVKGEKLYLIPNIGNIIAQVAKDSGNSDLGSLDLSSILNSLSGMSGKDIKALLSAFLKDLPLDLNLISDEKIEEVVGWLSTGIPLNYRVKDVTLENGKTLKALYVYVDKEFMDPFMPLLFPLLPTLDTLMQEAAPDFYPLLLMMTGLQSFRDIENIWKATTVFELGIELADRSFK